MCGRFGLTKPHWGLARQFGATISTAAFAPRYNIAPSQPVFAAVNDDERRVKELRWGLIPSGADNPAAVKLSLFNARIESLATAPAYRKAFLTRRCAIFADGYYEWRKNADNSKTPMWIFRRDGAPFAFAGVWDIWRSGNVEDLIESCSIVTQPPNAFVAPIHSRMPVVLANDAAIAWLDPRPRNAAELLALLEPTPAVLWSSYEVSPRVGNVRYDEPELLDPVR